MSLITIALARLRARIGLNAALLGALTIAVAIPAAIPMYVEASTARLLDAGVANSSDTRPTFSYLFAARSQNQSWSEIESIDAYIIGEATERLGLPTRHTSRLIETSRFPTELKTDSLETGGPEATTPDPVDLGPRPLATMSDATSVMTLTSGAMPGPPRFAENGSLSLDVIMQTEEAERNDVQVGDRLSSIDARIDPTDPGRTLELVVVGLWQAEPDDDRWIIDPELLANRLFISEEAMLEGIDQIRDDAVASTRWYAILDGTTLKTDDVGRLIERAAEVRREADEISPGTVLESDPIDSLITFRRRAGLLTRRLLSYGVPLLGLIAAFVSLIVSVATTSRRREILTLRHRGASPRTIVLTAAIESAILALASGVLGLIGARFLAALMGRTRSFLNFSNETGIAVGVSRPALLVAFCIALFGIAAQLIPVWLSARAVIGDSPNSRSSAARPPWWQRSSIDLMVILATGLVAWSVSRSQRTRTTEPLDDPTVMALPALLSLGAGLVVLRLIGPTLSTLASAVARTNSVGGLLALRRLARSPGTRSIPLLLLIMTVSLGTFTASMARTLDLQLFDEAHHAIGADRAITEAGAAIATPSVASDGFGSSTSFQPEPVPVESFERVWGIDQATRVGQLSGAVEAGLGQRSGVAVYAIQPESFTDVAFWRSDYSAEPLTELVERLDAQPEAVLVHRETAQQLDLRMGDTAELDLTFGRRLLTTRVIVVGFIDQFPTWNPASDDPAIIMNLDHVFNLSGEERLFDVWLRAGDEPIDPLQQDSDLASLGVRSLADLSPSARVEAAFDQPDRQGVFGLLSIGFISATLISVGALCLYSLSGLRSGLAEFGVLRAIGLSDRRLGSSIAIELGVLILVGITTGLAMGVGLSRWLIPVLLDTRPQPPAPQFLAVTDWAAVGAIAATLAALFAVLVIILLSVLRRLRMFEAIKLGESS